MKLNNALAILVMLLVTFIAGCTKNSNSPSPKMSSTVPTTNAINVPINTPITVNFSEAMDPLTITTSTFTLRQETAMAVTGTVTYSGTTAKFTPSVALTAGHNYTVTITTGVKNLTGTALAANIVWSFETAGTSSTQ